MGLLSSLDSSNIGSQCSCDFNDENFPKFGYLYNGAVIASSLNVCPGSWHVPSSEKYGVLADQVATGVNNEGGNLKSTGICKFNSGLWKSPNTNATDAFGFHGIPSGFFTNTGTFIWLHESAIFWTSSFFTASNIFVARLSFEKCNFLRTLQFSNDFGMSIGCPKD